MKESDFIEQNKEKWKTFEQNLLKKDATPQEISKLFVQITDDLSYARTFYNKRSVKLYLNGVAKLLFNDINKSNKNKRAVFTNFWKRELPQVMFASKRPMLISFLVFWCFFILGVVTSIYQPDFAETILGESYIKMTNQNIANGSPMHVYADDGEMETFLPILLNNLKVAFNTFFLGVFASLGSLCIMMYNGVMVGVFQFFFVEKEILNTMLEEEGAIRGFFHYFLFDNNLFRKSFLSIWTHGTLEISAIIIAGGAGITLGKGLLFPETYSRFQAFKMSARNGLKIILGISPVILLAAFIEGFLTRHTDIPDVLRFLFILLSLGFVLVYFVWFPKRVSKKMPETEAEQPFRPIYIKKTFFNPNEALSLAQLFSETLRVFFKHGGTYFLVISVASAFFAIAVATDTLGLFLVERYHYSTFTLSDYFNYSETTLLGVFSGLIFISILIFSTLFTRHKLLNLKGRLGLRSTPFKHTAISYFLCAPIFIGLISIGNSWFTFVALLLFPLLVLMSNISSYGDIRFFAAVSQTGGLLNKSWGKFILLSLFNFTLVGLFFLAAQSSLIEFIINSGVVSTLTNDPEFTAVLNYGISAFITSFCFISYLIFTVSSSGVLYFTLKETHTAKNLLSRIKAIKASS